MADMKKLLKVITELHVGKDRNNSFGKYKYRNAEDILAALKPLAVKYGVYPMITDGIEIVGDRYYVKATVKVYDADTGELLIENDSYAREPLNKKGMDDAQVTGSSSSYARKYALAGIFNLQVMEDSDGLEYPRIIELVKNLTTKGIDTDEFSRVVFNKGAEDLTPQEINNTVKEFNKYLDVYYKRAKSHYENRNVKKQAEHPRTEEKPRTEEMIEMLARNGIDANDFSKLVFNKELTELMPKQVNAVVMNFDKALDSYLMKDKARA